VTGVYSFAALVAMAGACLAVGMVDLAGLVAAGAPIFLIVGVLADTSRSLYHARDCERLSDLAVDDGAPVIDPEYDR
jgi:hypothetical protein